MESNLEWYSKADVEKVDKAEEIDQNSAVRVHLDIKAAHPLRSSVLDQQASVASETHGVASF